MRVFLTGSTGLLGINTVHALLTHGHEVLALARDPEKARRVLPKGPGVIVISGDISEPDTWLGRLSEADALVHCAAYFREYFGVGNHEAKLHALNVELPVTLAWAADRAGVKKTIMVSSSGVVCPRPDGIPATEEDPATNSVRENRYFQSKVEMEAALTRLAPELRHSLIVVRPGWMFGPNDFAPTTAGQMVLDLLRRGSVTLVGGTPLNTVDARDVAEGIVLALERCDRSTVYNIAGNPMRALDTLREMARQAAYGRVQEVPMPLALALGTVLEGITRLRGVANPIPPVGLQTLHRGVSLSSEKAERELGVRFRPFSETARDTVGFFRTVFPGASASS